MIVSLVAKVEKYVLRWRSLFVVNIGSLNFIFSRIRNPIVLHA